MWWKCDVQFFRTILRLKVWARNEPEARSKILRMYQVATIRCLAPAGADSAPHRDEVQRESAVFQELVKKSR
jgi:hypothetical protein